MESFKAFPGKILLFGEYGIIEGGEALSIPYHQRTGTLAFPEEEHLLSQEVKDSQSSLAAFHEYLSSNLLPEAINLEKLGADLDKGLYFKSSLPQGYGAGSSGALIAALYSAYSLNTQMPLEGLKRQFAAMESYFHGQSSGLDPLVSFCGCPIHLQPGKKPAKTPVSQGDGPGGFFIIDSGQIGITSAMVSIFKGKMKNPDYREEVSKSFIPLNSHCIKAFISGNTEELTTRTIELSILSLRLFSEMIPLHIRSLWKAGLNNGAYALKLCGSGGGGFFLGFTEDMPKAAESLSEHGFEAIWAAR